MANEAKSEAKAAGESGFAERLDNYFGLKEQGTDVRPNSSPA